MTRQEELFFNRVALKMSVDPTLTIDTAAQSVCNDDVRILNTYARLSNANQSELKRQFVARVYAALTEGSRP